MMQTIDESAAARSVDRHERGPQANDAPTADRSAGNREIVFRTRGHSTGPMSRLMSPSDLGSFLKPFVFLDFVDYQGPEHRGELHPHSGIATVSYMAEGVIDYIDPDGHTGTLTRGGVEFMHAGRGMWHGGGIQAGHTRGFQLWIALPPELEMTPPSSTYVPAELVAHDGPARVLFGSYGSATAGPLVSPMPIAYLAVDLAEGESWTYQPPLGHSVLWATVASGELRAPSAIEPGELIAFERSEQAVTFTANVATEFVLGSAAPHPHELHLGNFSVHTSSTTLREGEHEIDAIGRKLRRVGRR
jgi:redox-sensitive bicupin YhaK (pirin superfamily)